MNIYIELLDDESFQIQAQKSWKMIDLKRAIYELKNILPENQTIIF